MEAKAPWQQVAILLVTILFAHIVFKWYSQRAFFRRMAKKYDLPCLPNPPWIFGDLLTIGRITAKYPTDTHGQLVPSLLMKHYPNIADMGVIYLDVWPTASPFCAVWDPDLIAQFTQQNPRPKHEFIRQQFRPFTGLKDIVLSGGAGWKKWRAAFNPGFAMSNIMALVPWFVEEALVWRKYLDQAAQDGKTIRLETSAMEVTCDIIVRAVLGVSIGVQTGEDTKIYPSMKRAIAQLVPNWSSSTLGRFLNPWRHSRLQANNKVLSDELRDRIYEQFYNHERAEGPKTINSLAINMYLKDKGNAPDNSNEIDPDYLSYAVENIKMFLFAGHDTTATTLCYCYYYLHQHPDVLEKLRGEHNDIFSVRAGAPDFFLTHPMTRQRLPSDGFMLWAVSKAVQRHPAYWEEPDAFMPERWLTGETTKNAWRAFELGPRACIGHELAMTELRMLLVMTVRDLEIILEYNEGDPQVLGSQAYQVTMSEELTAHPRNGMPVKVKLRQRRDS
ncbi:hypothetical protein FSARC_14877 [Fusarium sarcochroum]|uniref:Cytochrome P450 monooxygenase n=1 Tax=Fusarium sarcochroum TaxID=1208366 RepID=A0A8H4SQC2_9HYPO|nr:hypothetical protein FSARC_14877 [Fusarium sarcochroum]